MHGWKILAMTSDSGQFLWIKCCRYVKMKHFLSFVINVNTFFLIKCMITLIILRCYYFVVICLQYKVHTDMWTHMTVCKHIQTWSSLARSISVGKSSGYPTTRPRRCRWPIVPNIAHSLINHGTKYLIWNKCYSCEPTCIVRQCKNSIIYVLCKINIFSEMPTICNYHTRIYNVTIMCVIYVYKLHGNVIFVIWQAIKVHYEW